jgi:tyrosine-protein phosphatase YwqE
MLLFRKKAEGLADLSAIGVDFHNHVIPGIDDGSPTLEESVKMLRLFAELGYRKVIATPHVITDLYPNTREVILGQMYNLQDIVSENGIPLELEASAEYRLDFEFREKMEQGELIPLGKTNYILIELPFQKPAFSLDEIIFDIRTAGFEPILAHPERYLFLYTNIKNYYPLKDAGLLFQLNLNSLGGMYNGLVRKASEKLIKNNMIEFVSSDAHHVAHLMEMKKLLRNKSLINLIASGSLKNTELL